MMRTIDLGRLRPGTRFCVPALGITGELLRATDCAATVRLDGRPKEVEFVARDGSVRHFQARGGKVTSWAPATQVCIDNREER